MSKEHINADTTKCIRGKKRYGLLILCSSAPNPTALISPLHYKRTYKCCMEMMLAMVVAH